MTITIQAACRGAIEAVGINPGAIPIGRKQDKLRCFGQIHRQDNQDVILGQPEALRHFGIVECRPVAAEIDRLAGVARAVGPGPGRAGRP